MLRSYKKSGLGPKSKVSIKKGCDGNDPRNREYIIVRTENRYKATGRGTYFKMPIKGVVRLFRQRTSCQPQINGFDAQFGCR